MVSLYRRRARCRDDCERQLRLWQDQPFCDSCARSLWAERGGRAGGSIWMVWHAKASVSRPSNPRYPFGCGRHRLDDGWRLPDLACAGGVRIRRTLGDLALLQFPPCGRDQLVYQHVFQLCLRAGYRNPRVFTARQSRAGLGGVDARAKLVGLPRRRDRSRHRLAQQRRGRQNSAAVHYAFDVCGSGVYGCFTGCAGFRRVFYRESHRRGAGCARSRAEPAV